MSLNNGFGGVAECYAFKSRLQEYAQKVGFTTPVYHTVMEGPPHEPIFRSTVIVNNIEYESLPGFYNRKTAEQSAAEVALMEISKSGQMTECIPTVHETGLCKNLLQEYAQKMNFAVPVYTCKKLPSDNNSISCTVEIGGIRYIGAAAKTKKEAEIKAARTALLAIQSDSSCRGETSGISIYTVLPGKRKWKETEAPAETVKPIITKKTKFRKNGHKKNIARKNKLDKSNFGSKMQVDKEEVGVADGNSEMLETGRNSASAFVEEPKSLDYRCGSSRIEDYTGNCDGFCPISASAMNSNFREGLAGELHHVGWMEENYIFDALATDGVQCVNDKEMLVSPLYRPDFSGNVSCTDNMCELLIMLAEGTAAPGSGDAGS